MKPGHHAIAVVHILVQVDAKDVLDHAEEDANIIVVVDVPTAVMDLAEQHVQHPAHQGVKALALVLVKLPAWVYVVMDLCKLI